MSGFRRPLGRSVGKNVMVCNNFTVKDLHKYYT